jgi:polysaccharide pyruvyl transferase WcaK-like protein
VIPTAPTFYATPAAAAEVSRAKAIAILVGGYDGSGNYGDLAQLDATLGMLGRFEPGLLLLPVLERSRVVDHGEQVAGFLRPPTQVLFFGPEEGYEDDLVPVPAPANPAFAACYLYGGGYLNRYWGERKLAMLRAAEALLEGGGATEICRLSSGLQADARWIAGLDPADSARLASFAPLGARDPRSAEALASLGEALDGGDDAIGILGRLPVDAAPEPDARLHVNVHVGGEGWISENAERIAELFADFLAELRRRAGLPVIAHPLIAYLGRHIDERPQVARLEAVCASRSIGFAEPVVLRPARLAAISPELRRAALTLTCSYHVALTSLMLEIPALLLRDNPYYEQKAGGLADAFGLPDAFTLDLSADPVERAREIAGIVLDERGNGALRNRVALGASHLRARRTHAEVELLARLGSAASAALNARMVEIEERLCERSAEPAELHARVSMLGSELEAMATRTPADGASEETLQTILASRSWRMTEPLRRIGRRLHSRR